MFAIYLLALIAFINANEFELFENNDIYDEVRDSRNLTGKVVLVTGSSSGIGEQIVKLFSALGASVVVTGINDTDIQRVVQETQELSPHKLKPLGVTADLTKMAELDHLLDETIKTFGKLDVLVNNAGLYLLASIADKRFLDIFDEFEKVDTRAALQLIQNAIPYLGRTNGTIINVSSVLTERPQKSMLAYEMAKQALELSTEILSLELAPQGIRANTISQGAVQSHPLNQTDPIAVARYNNSVSHTPLARIGVPIDIAKGVVFLASSDADFITGHNLVVDGGIRYNMDS
ncbi:unnamed protein product, partial [Oppiella nova]